MKYKKYQLLDGGKVVYEGSKREIAEKLGITQGSIEHATRRSKDKDYLYQGRYRLEFVCEVEIAPKPKKKRWEINGNEDVMTPMQHLVFHLYKCKYDSTYCSFNPACYLPDLLDCYGLDCRIRMIEKYHEKAVSRQHRKKNVGYDYVVEVVGRH